MLVTALLSQAKRASPIIAAHPIIALEALPDTTLSLYSTASDDKRQMAPPQRQGLRAVVDVTNKAVPPKERATCATP